MQASIQRRVSVALAAVVASILVVTVGAGVAWALNVDCALNPVALCVGTNNDDELEGEDVNDGVQGRKDLIRGKGGSDGADGKGGDDKIFGGNGADGDFAVNDALEGGDGKDLVSGGNGDDHRIQGLAGRDTVLGGRGSDEEVFGDQGNDTVDGGPSVDEKVEGNEGEDNVNGGSGGDLEVRGGSGDDNVNGGPGDDGGVFIFGALTGDDGNNKVHGGSGDDEIDARASLPGEVEDIFGDGDDDTIRADDGEVDNIDCGAGSNDTVTFDAAVDILSNDCEIKFPV